MFNAISDYIEPFVPSQYLSVRFVHIVQNEGTKGYNSLEDNDIYFRMKSMEGSVYF
jgi:hypothetical protein